jgi:hypothetical protein
VIGGREKRIGKPMLHYAVASSLRVHGDSSRDGSERSLDSLENNVA